MKKFFFTLVLALLSFFVVSSPIYAVPVRTYGGVTATSGNYYLKSDNTGNGNLTPGTSVVVDSYLFQCKTKGTAGCSTEHNNDATLVQKWQDTQTVPQLNKQNSRITHNFTLPYGKCGRVQYDQGIVGIPGAIGGWVYDFGKDCADTTPVQNTCEGQTPVVTRFRKSGNGAWISGGEMTSANLPVGQAIDVNCFAKNGTALLQDGYIEVTAPGNQTARVSNTPELRNFTLQSTGQYTFRCGSTTMNACTNSDSFTVPSSSVIVLNDHRSSCDNLRVVAGNDSTVPAKVTLRATASDNKGNIQRYRFYFGDGEQQESTNAEVTHEYKSSGNFIARSDIQDSRGNWKSSTVCETTVTVKPSSVESHKSGCSNLFITANNNGRAPSKVNFAITGFDNKGNLQKYKLDFGNGVTKESDGRTFEEIYNQAGTYTIRAYVRNSRGEWVGGEEGCRRTLTIGSNRPLTSQPATGTPTTLPLVGVGSALVGGALQVIKRKWRI